MVYCQVDEYMVGVLANPYVFWLVTGVDVVGGGEWGRVLGQ